MTRANGDIKDNVGRPVDNGQIGVVDPDTRLIGLHLYDGLLKVGCRLAAHSPGCMHAAQCLSPFHARKIKLQCRDGLLKVRLRSLWGRGLTVPMPSSV